MNIDSKKLNTLFQYVMQNPYSDFYRNHYESLGSVPQKIQSYDEWKQLPFLTKSDVLSVPLQERTFTDRKHVDMFKNTSGTSGNEILVIPRTRSIDYSDIFTKFPIRGFLNFHQPAYSVAKSVHDDFPDVPVIAGDSVQMEMSVVLAQKAEANALMVFLFHLEMLIPLLQKYEMMEQFVYVHIIGERVTESQYVYLKTMFHNAHIYNDYGAAELQGSPLIALNNGHVAERFVMTQWDDYFIEIIDPDTEKVIVDDGIEGELVVTTLWTDTNTSPFLRYRTGDMVERMSTEQHHSGKGYRVHGRIDLDRIKVTGGEIKVEEVERVLDQCVPGWLDYELHVSQEDGVHVVALLIASDAAVDTEKSAREFSHNFRLAPTYTYSDGVRKGVFQPLSVRVVSKLGSPTKKKKRLHNHTGE